MDFSIKKIIAVVGFAIGAVGLQAQPIAIQQHLAPIGNSATQTITGYTAARLDAADNAPTGKPQALSVGRLITANYTPQTNGQWQKVANGYIWRIKVVAEGAKGISFFGKVNYLPKGSQLNIYNADGSQWVHAYTYKSFIGQPILSSEIVKGEEAIIEYFKPDGVQDDPQFVIEKVGYIYRIDHDKDMANTAGFGSAGSCNVNINCEEGEHWKFVKNAVARIRCLTDFNILWCTGTLVNNTNGDFKPYMLTAMHCGINGTGKALINDTLFKYWLFYFNYESPDCTNPDSDTALDDRVITGSHVLAYSDDEGGEKGSDFLLVELDQKPPLLWNPYYAGWNIDTLEQKDSGACIHHPAWDIKKISTYRWPLSFEAPYFTSPDKTHWEVLWSPTKNGHGITQGGSSGSALFDYDGHIVGTLTGGNSSCASPNMTDLFGRMDWHFSKNGTDSTRQLKYWLDPKGTNTTKHNGKAEYALAVEKITTLPLQLFPNPAQNNLQYSHPQLANNEVQVEIIDVMGKVYTTTIVQNNTIAVGHLPAGIYFISLKEKNNFFTGKFIKQ